MLPAFGRYFAVLSLLAALAIYACGAPARAVVAPTSPEFSQTVVNVAIVIRNIIAVDEVKENWQVSGLLIAEWSDPSLKYRSRRRGNVFRDLPTNAWRPQLEFVNEETPTAFRFVDFYVKPDGTVVYTQRFTATLSTSLNLRRFPFDSQVLPLDVQASGDDLDRTTLKPDREDTSLRNRAYVGLAQWAPVSLEANTDRVAGSASHATEVEFGLKVRRNPKSYVFKFFIPLLLLVIISWVTFWLSHEEFKTKEQLGSAVSTLLIIVAFNITASTFLPKTDYLTYIDVLVFTCFVFVVVSIATIVGIHVVQIKRSEKLALSLRRLAGVLLPLAFLITQAILYVNFHAAG